LQGNSHALFQGTILVSACTDRKNH